MNIIVGGTMNQQIIPLHRACMRYGRTIFVAIRIVAWCTHVPFGVNRIVKTPVGDRSDRYPGVEYAVSFGHTQCSGEATIAPAPNAYSFTINIRQAFKVFCCINQVVGFKLAQLKVGALSELFAPGSCSSWVDSAHHIALLGQKIVPVDLPARGYLLLIWTTVFGHDDRVFAAWVKKRRFQHRSVQP